MTLTNRMSLVVGLLVIAAVGRIWLSGHLLVATEVEKGKLTTTLVDFPMKIGQWQGRDVPIEDKDWLYADQHLQRDYTNVSKRRTARVWMAYSPVSADRIHHPEICQAMLNQQEDPSGNKQLVVEGHERPIQQYRYGRPGMPQQQIYYWYYTIRSEDEKRLDKVQRLYQKLQVKPASITIEVFIPYLNESDETTAHEFITQLDAELQKLVGPDAVRGSTRLPVTVIEGQDPHQE